MAPPRCAASIHALTMHRSRRVKLRPLANLSDHAHETVSDEGQAAASSGDSVDHGVARGHQNFDHIDAVEATALAVVMQSISLLRPRGHMMAHVIG